MNTSFDLLAETIRVLIGDDHRIVREGLKQILADAPDVQVVAEAQTGEEVLAKVREAGGSLGLDLVLLDIAMPGLNGVEVLQAIRREHPRLPVLMLSTYPESQSAAHCIRLGARGYLNKSADPEDMLLAVRKAAGGAVFLNQAAAVGAGDRQAGPDTFSHLEYQVYRLLVQGRTLSEIGAQLSLSPAEVNHSRSRILEKTGAKNDAELALYAERHARTP